MKPHRVLIAIRSNGDADNLRNALRCTVSQVYNSDLIVSAVVCDASNSRIIEDITFETDAEYVMRVDYIATPPSLAANSNAALKQTMDTRSDFVILFDDDSTFANDFVAKMMRLNDAEKDVVFSTEVPLRPKEAAFLYVHPDDDDQSGLTISTTGARLSRRIIERGLKFDERPRAVGVEDDYFFREAAYMAAICQRNNGLPYFRTEMARTYAAATIVQVAHNIAFSLALSGKLQCAGIGGRTGIAMLAAKSLLQAPLHFLAVPMIWLIYGANESKIAIRSGLSSAGMAAGLIRAILFAFDMARPPVEHIVSSRKDAFVRKPDIANSDHA